MGRSKDIFLAILGSLLLLSQVFIQARNGEVSAIITLGGLACVGVPLWGLVRRNGNGNGGGGR